MNIEIFLRRYFVDIDTARRDRRENIMSRKLLVLMLGSIVALAMIGCAGLPENIVSQSLRNSQIQHDSLARNRFLQNELTAQVSKARSGSKLDGSAGEQLIELEVDPTLEAKEVTWLVANTGQKPIWIIAAGGYKRELPKGLADRICSLRNPDDCEATPERIPFEVFGGETVKLRSEPNKDFYTFIVVDNEAGQTEVVVKATFAESDAQTPSGNPLQVRWF